MNIFPNKNLFCRHFTACSGCKFDVNEEPLIWLEVEAYFKNKKISINLIKGPSTKWRCRAKLAVRGHYKSPQIGLFKEGSHQVEAIPYCEIHHPHINKAIELIKKLIHNQSLSIYDEINHQGHLRYLQCVVERETGKVQVTFVLNLKDQKDIDLWKKNLSKLLNEENLFHSIWINLNTLKTNTIFGPNWELIGGEEFLCETFEKTKIYFHPSSFAQANLDLFETLLKNLKKWVPNNSRIAEFYAGVGVIGLFLINQCEWIKCAEINSSAELCFLLSRAQLPVSDAEKISFYTGDVKNQLKILSEADVAIVDPPRKGLDIELLKALNSTTHLKRLIYISCGWDSFKKDCDSLLNNGWSLTFVEGYLFFPGSNHIEIVAVFDKAHAQEIKRL